MVLLLGFATPAGAETTDALNAVVDPVVENSGADDAAPAVPVETEAASPAEGAAPVTSDDEASVEAQPAPAPEPRSTPVRSLANSIDLGSSARQAVTTTASRASELAEDTMQSTGEVAAAVTESTDSVASVTEGGKAVGIVVGSARDCARASRQDRGRGRDRPGLDLRTTLQSSRIGAVSGGSRLAGHKRRFARSGWSRRQYLLASPGVLASPGGRFSELAARRPRPHCATRHPRRLALPLPRRIWRHRALPTLCAPQRRFHRRWRPVTVEDRCPRRLFRRERWSAGESRFPRWRRPATAARIFPSRRVLRIGRLLLCSHRRVAGVARAGCADDLPQTQGDACLRGANSLRLRARAPWLGPRGPQPGLRREP